jgi:hypothetical protein
LLLIIMDVRLIAVRLIAVNCVLLIVFRN